MIVEHCVLMHIFFRKQPGCALIGACALIRTNTVDLVNQNSSTRAGTMVHMKFRQFVIFLRPGGAWL